MDVQALDAATLAAINELKLEKLSEKQMGLDDLYEFALATEKTAIKASKLASLSPKHHLKPVIGKITKPKFQKKLATEIRKEVRRIICERLEDKIDTKEERRAVVDKYDDVIVTLIIGTYPPLAPARPAVKVLVRFLLAQGLVAAAKNMGRYCGV